jgi:hypothetical protein
MLTYADVCSDALLHTHHAALASLARLLGEGEEEGGGGHFVTSPPPRPQELHSKRWGVCVCGGGVEVVALVEVADAGGC